MTSHLTFGMISRLSYLIVLCFIASQWNMTTSFSSTKFSFTSREFLLKRIVNSFSESKFRVDNFFVKNPHYQTIVGSEALRLKFLGDYPRTFSTKHVRWDTPDGDFVDLEFTTDNEDSKGLVVILHGLESNPKSPLGAFLAKGFQCCLVSFRSCSYHGPPTKGGGVIVEDNLTVGAYHLGFTDDINFITKRIFEEIYPEKSIYLSGFSLGGNVILKFLGELGDEAWDRNIRGAAVTCVPFDPVACQSKIDKGFNRAVYSENFLRSLKQKAERKINKFPNAFDIEAIRKCRTIGEFDDLFIAKIYGFEDNIDYYRKTGSKWFLPKIRVPVIAVNALDDPFIEVTSLPTDNDVGDAPVRLIYHKHGGHCGFIGHVEDYSKTEDDLIYGDNGSGEAAETLRSEAYGIDSNNFKFKSMKRTREERISTHGWLSEELSCGLDHIHVLNNALLFKDDINYDEIDVSILQKLMI